MIKEIRINAKHDDRYAARIINDDGSDVVHEGYGLRMDGIGGGDYLKFTIENATGKIVGWTPLTEETLDDLING